MDWQDEPPSEQDRRLPLVGDFAAWEAELLGWIDDEYLCR